MKRLIIFISVFWVSNFVFSNSYLNTVFTLKGTVSDLSGEVFFENFPVTIYPDISDTTNKFTVYTNNRGFYHFSHHYDNVEKIMVVLKAFCDNDWIYYCDTIAVQQGVTTKNYNICHNPEWFIKKLVVQGFVSDSLTGNPISNHPVIIINHSVTLMSYTLYTNQNGFYSDTFLSLIHI